MKLLVLESIFNVTDYSKADIVFAGETVNWDGKLSINASRDKVKITVSDKNGVKYTAPVDQFEVLEPVESQSVVNVNVADPAKVAERLSNELYRNTRGTTIGRAFVDVVPKKPTNKLAKDLNLGDMVKFGNGQKEPYKVTGLEVSYANTVVIHYVDANGYSDKTSRDYNYSVTLA